jgi:arylsulfatase A-like enzyme
MVRWPGVVEADSVINELFAHGDWLPTLIHAAGVPDIGAKLLKGYKAAGKTYKVHLDGYDQTDLLKGDGEGTRREFHHITDDGDYAAFRYDKWKITFLTQECNGFDVWDCEYKGHRAPRITNLRSDPYEFAQQANASWNYQEWTFRHGYLYVPAQKYVGAFVNSFVKFPPRGLPASFSVGDALKAMATPTHN